MSRPINAIKKIIELPTLRYNNIKILDKKVIIQAESLKKTSVCPICNKRNNRVHSFYIRTIKDLPICGNATYIELRIRRFFCINKYCKRKI